MLRYDDIAPLSDADLTTLHAARALLGRDTLTFSDLDAMILAMMAFDDLIVVGEALAIVAGAVARRPDLRAADGQAIGDAFTAYCREVDTRLVAVTALIG